ncbi:unnamed protein product [Calicophoron daubneyi]|uniref:Uncharacterized protein n=1 Tax=Calicophoron daubneyi TaxID=300641 RepID=A0AAV2T2F6_CALDB
MAIVLEETAHLKNIYFFREHPIMYPSMSCWTPITFPLYLLRGCLAQSGQSEDIILTTGLTYVANYRIPRKSKLPRLAQVRLMYIERDLRQRIILSTFVCPSVKEISCISVRLGLSIKRYAIDTYLIYLTNHGQSSSSIFHRTTDGRGISGIRQISTVKRLLWNISCPTMDHVTPPANHINSANQAFCYHGGWKGTSLKKIRCADLVPWMEVGLSLLRPVFLLYILLAQQRLAEKRNCLQNLRCAKLTVLREELEMATEFHTPETVGFIAPVLSENDASVTGANEIHSGMWERMLDRIILCILFTYIQNNAGNVKETNRAIKGDAFLSTFLKDLKIFDLRSTVHGEGLTRSKGADLADETKNRVVVRNFNRCRIADLFPCHTEESYSLQSFEVSSRFIPASRKLATSGIVSVTRMKLTQHLEFVHPVKFHGVLWSSLQNYLQSAFTLRTTDDILEPGEVSFLLHYRDSSELQKMIKTDTIRSYTQPVSMLGNIQVMRGKKRLNSDDIYSMKPLATFSHEEDLQKELCVHRQSMPSAFTTVRQSRRRHCSRASPSGDEYNSENTCISCALNTEVLQISLENRDSSPLISNSFGPDNHHYSISSQSNRYKKIQNNNLHVMPTVCVCTACATRFGLPSSPLLPFRLLTLRTVEKPDQARIVNHLSYEARGSCGWAQTDRLVSGDGTERKSNESQEVRGNKSNGIRRVLNFTWFSESLKVRISRGVRLKFRALVRYFSHKATKSRDRLRTERPMCWS